MDSTQKAKELVVRAAEIRIGMGKYYREYSKLKRLFAELFGVHGKFLKHAVDALFYLGGSNVGGIKYRDRLQESVDQLANVYKILHLAGESDVVQEMLADHGLQLTLVKPLRDVKLPETYLVELGKKYHLPLPLTAERTSDVVRFLIASGSTLQAAICKDADRVKLGIKPKMKRQYAVLGQEFARLVGIEKSSIARKPVIAFRHINVTEKSVGMFEQIVNVDKAKIKRQAESMKTKQEI